MATTSSRKTTKSVRVSQPTEPETTPQRPAFQPAVSLQDKLVPVMYIALLGAAFALGMMYGKVSVYESGNLTRNTTAGTTADAGAAAAPQGGVNLSIPSLKAMAAELSLDEDQFNSCLDDGKYAQKVKDDMAYGQEVGVSGTPSFFINKVMIVGAQPQTVFEDVIDFELAKGNWESPSDKVAYLVDGNPSNGEVTLQDTPVKTGVGYIQGNKNASVYLVEFSDFECPFCARAFPTVEAVMDKYGDRIALEYRHFPLSFHPNAQKAGEASECAAEQDKFWEMHDRMFQG